MTHRKKILLVDDDEALLARADAILANEFLTASVISGTDALAPLPVFKPDLVLLDIEMPGQNGLEVCREIRKDPKFRFLKIMFVSGKVTLEDRLEGYKAGGDDYITKPYDSEELLAKVNILLRLKYEEEMSKLKSDFLSLIQHELRTPLNGIIGFAQLLKEEDSSEVREIAHHLLQSGTRLSTIIEKILLLTTLKASQSLDKKTVASVLSQIQTILKELQDDIRQKNITVSLHGDYELEANWPLLNRGFLYLLENAVKFSPAESEVNIEIAIHNENEMIIRFIDQGKGIEPEMANLIFNEFAIQDIMHHQSGLGISLAIVKQIVEMHDGDINVGNAIKGGAIFTLTFPVKTTRQISNP